ncbi:MAG: hypothetical protein HQM11_07760 [SAR324 cluster bacterium]|nr:hypothetical protein [SAR324 cluster bacterium]
MKKIHIATSPMTGKIYAGSILKTGSFGADKQEVTIHALVAVAEHIVKQGNSIKIFEDDKPVFEIAVKRLT